MIALVPRLAPGKFASAVVRQLRSRMDGIGQRDHGNNQFGSDDQIVSLQAEKGEAPAPPAHVLDTSKARDKGIWNPEGFQHFPLFVHDACSIAPRDSRALSASLPPEARGLMRGYTSGSARGDRLVNAAPEFARVAS